MDVFMKVFLSVVAALILLPFVAYVVMKFGTAGYLVARRFFNREENESGERQGRRP